MNSAGDPGSGERAAYSAGNETVIEGQRQALELAVHGAPLSAVLDVLVRTVEFQHAPAAIAVLRGAGHVFEVANPRYAELVGGRAVLGKSLHEALPELEGLGFGELLDGVYRTGEPHVGRSQRVMLARGPGGALEEAFVDFVYQPVPAADGVIDSIFVIAFEVTELARARLDAEAARAEAEASERNLKTFIDNLPELAWTARPDGHIDYYNRRWYGVPRWFLTRVAPARDAAGKIARWFGTNTNIDDMKAAQALSEAMVEQSRDTQRMLLTMRADKERAERRVAELEAERAAR